KTAGTGAIEGDAEYGGFLVPEEFRATLLQDAIEQSNIINLCMSIPMSTNTINIPYVKDTDHSGGTVFGGVKFYWLDELDEITATRPKVGNVNLRLKKAAGMCYASSEMLEDSPISIQPLLTSQFRQALTWTLDGVMISGTGAGQPLGIKNAPALISVAKETGQDADTVVANNVLKMYQRLWTASSNRAIWLASKDTFTQLANMSITVGTGGAPLWMPSGGLSGKPYQTLMGMPLYYSEHCETLGDKGDLYLADWSQYLVGQKVGVGAGMNFATSI
ncbi:unnamed protein product, partial [marine sediment metagenome]